MIECKPLFESTWKTKYFTGTALNAVNSILMVAAKDLSLFIVPFNKELSAGLKETSTKPDKAFSEHKTDELGRVRVVTIDLASNEENILQRHPWLLEIQKRSAREILKGFGVFHATDRADLHRERLLQSWYSQMASSKD